MKFSYKKIFNKNYLILSNGNISDYKECYRSKMLKSNSLEHFLQYDTQLVNGVLEFTYDISSKQTLYSFYENSDIDYNMLCHLIITLHSATEILNHYLLEPDYMVLNPEYIYMNVATKKIYFCYCPGEYEPFYDSLKNFLNYLITKINHQDKNSILLAYSLQQQSFTPNFTMDELMKILKDSSFDTPSETPSNSDISFTAINNFEPDIPNQEDTLYFDTDTSFQPSFSKENENRQHFYFSVILWALGIALFTYLHFYHSGISSLIKWILTAADLFICIITTFYLFSKKEIASSINENSINEKNTFEDSLYMPHTDSKNSDLVSQRNTIDFSTPNTIKPDKKSYYEDTVILGYRHGDTAPRLVYTGTDFTSETELTQFPFLIGKMEENVHMVIDNSMISRIHAKIYKKENCYYIEDMNSSNGTYINNENIPSHTLTEIHSGDYITFSHLTYIFQ